jgi:hypothetical protein
VSSQIFSMKMNIDAKYTSLTYYVMAYL